MTASEARREPGPPIELEVSLDAPPAEVFRYFTEPERYVRWQGVAAELDPRPGGVYRVAMETGATVEGRYLVVEAPHRVSFSWGWPSNPDLPPGSSTVEVELSPAGDGTRLRLRHEGIPGGPLRAAHDGGWRDHLGRLGPVVAAGS